MRYAFCNSLWSSALRRGHFGTDIQRWLGRLPSQAGGRHDLRGLVLLPPPAARPLTEAGLPPLVARPTLRRSGMGSRGPTLSLDTGLRRALPGAVALAAVVRPADHHHLLADAAVEPARRLRRCTRPRDARRKRSQGLSCGPSEGVCPLDWAATDSRGSRRRIEGPVFPDGPKRLTPTSSRRHRPMPLCLPLSTAFPTALATKEATEGNQRGRRHSSHREGRKETTKQTLLAKRGTQRS